MSYVRRTGESIAWLSGWSKPTVNIGRGQLVENVVNTKAVQKDDVAVIQRQGGGGAVYLQPGCELSWSLVTPSKERADSHKAIYEEVCGQLVSFLSSINISAEHEPVNDVVTGKGKVSGGTLYESDGVVYTGATMLYDVHPEAMQRYLQDIDPSRVDAITNHTDIGFDEACKQFKHTVIDEADESMWTNDEMQRAKKHAETYQNR